MNKHQAPLNLANCSAEHAHRYWYNYLRCCGWLVTHIPGPGAGYCQVIWTDQAMENKHRIKKSEWVKLKWFFMGSSLRHFRSPVTLPGPPLSLLPGDPRIRRSPAFHHLSLIFCSVLFFSLNSVSSTQKHSHFLNEIKLFTGRKEKKKCCLNKQTKQVFSKAEWL